MTKGCFSTDEELHPHLVQVPVELFADGPEGAAFREPVFIMETDAVFVKRGDARQDGVDLHRPRVRDQLINNGRTYAFFYVIGRDEAGELGGPGKSVQPVMRAQKPIADDLFSLDLARVRHIERVAFCHIQEQVEEFIRDLFLRVGGEGILDVMVENVDNGDLIDIGRRTDGVFQNILPSLVDRLRPIILNN
jgi:hypothetical protein